MADYPYNNTPFIHPSGLFTPHWYSNSPQYFTAPSPPVHKEPQEQASSPIEYHFHYHYPPEAFIPSYFDNMSRKTVHWDDDVPRTPSPAMSTSSLASSAGPITPDTFTHPLPQVHVQYPPQHYGMYLSGAAGHSPYQQKSSSITINPVLATVAFVDPRSRPFTWALYDHPNTLHPRADQSPSATRSPPKYPVPPSTLGLPATSPPLAHLTISCALLPFYIVVPASRSYGHEYVTVGDVFTEIYKQLRIQLTHTEYAQLCSGNREVKYGVDKAYFSRTAHAREDRETTKQQGLRRSDLLMESQMFAGLDMRSDDTAVLHVQPLPQH